MGRAGSVPHRRFRRRRRRHYGRRRCRRRRRGCGCRCSGTLCLNYFCPVGAPIIWPITSKLVSRACWDFFPILVLVTFLELIINIFDEF